MSLLNYLNIGFFNINGILGQKRFDPSFTELIKKYDIIALTETWHTNDTCMQNLNAIHFIIPAKSQRTSTTGTSTCS